MNPKNMRSVEFDASTEEELMAGLGGIPGFELTDVPRDRLHAPEGKFMLVAADGSEIHLWHEPGAARARTSNVLGPNGSTGQDHQAGPVPFEDDLVVQLESAVQRMETATFRGRLQISENDLKKLRGEEPALA